MSDDAVNHPKHYTSLPATCGKCGAGIECIDVVEHMSFGLGNAVKYIWRADAKGSPTQDLEKAIWYLQREIERRKAVTTCRADIFDRDGVLVTGYPSYSEVGDVMTKAQARVLAGDALAQPHARVAALDEDAKAGRIATRARLRCIQVMEDLERECAQLSDWVAPKEVRRVAVPENRNAPEASQAKEAFNQHLHYQEAGC